MLSCYYISIIDFFECIFKKQKLEILLYITVICFLIIIGLQWRTINHLKTELVTKPKLPSIIIIRSFSITKIQKELSEIENNYHSLQEKYGVKELDRYAELLTMFYESRYGEQ